MRIPADRDPLRINDSLYRLRERDRMPELVIVTISQYAV
jgi:hypothetical protein